MKNGKIEGELENGDDVIIVMSVYVSLTKKVYFDQSDSLPRAGLNVGQTKNKTLPFPSTLCVVSHLQVYYLQD